MSSSFPARPPMSPNPPRPLLTVCFLSSPYPLPSVEQYSAVPVIWGQPANRDTKSDAAMMERVLPKNPDLETEEETHHSWHIENWRKLDRKLHGPVFKCGGYPWWVIIPNELVLELT